MSNSRPHQPSRSRSCINFSTLCLSCCSTVFLGLLTDWLRLSGLTTSGLAADPTGVFRGVEGEGAPEELLEELLDDLEDDLCSRWEGIASLPVRVFRLRSSNSLDTRRPRCEANLAPAEDKGRQLMYLLFL